MDEMTIAIEVAKRCNGSVAFTLSGGHAVFSEGARILFPAGRDISCKRNETGRVTKSVTEYHDGSRLTYTWSRDRGYRLIPS